APYAKKSFEGFSQVFVDGGIIHKFFEDQWADERKNKRLLRRTPLQIERDRILYSSGAKKQTEKYHVLYNGQRRIVRNYITHTMRMMQVTRAICRGLDLNGDFAEAIALGSKVGALPFIHASKGEVSEWIKNKIISLDKEKPADFRDESRTQFSLNFQGSPLPVWIQNLKSEAIVEKVKKYLPWAAGQETEVAYSSGQQGYWQLCTNPYTLESRPNSFSPETMFGIWRHSRGLPVGLNTFFHKCPFDEAFSGYHEINWRHVTYEGIVVQYADDITWIIENLADANHAALLNARPNGIFDELISALGGDVPSALLRAITSRDSGGIYTYFVSDFISYSENALNKLKDGAGERIALREGTGKEALIGLSPAAEVQLKQLKKFLFDKVFEKEYRVHNRMVMLKTVSEACMDLLYDGVEDILPRYITEK